MYQLKRKLTIILLIKTVKSENSSLLISDKFYVYWLLEQVIQKIV